MRAALVDAAKIAALGAVAFAFVTLGLFGLEARKQARAVGNQLNVVIAHVDEAAKQSVAVSRDTRINLVHLDRNQQRISRRALAVLDNFDSQVNGELLPAATALLKHQDENLTLVAGKAKWTMDDLQPAIAHFNESARSVQELTRDPALHDLAVRLDGSATQSEAILNEIREEIYELRHPPKKSKGRKVADWILQYVIGNAIKGAASR